MKQKFKAGDKVYCPRLGSKIFTVRQEKDYHGMDNLRVGVVGGRIVNFDSSGIANPLLCKGQQVVTHATTESYEMLSKLYPNTEFEAPPKRKTPKEVIQAMLDSGWDSVPCYVSDDDEATAIRNGIKSLIDMGSIDSWDFCIPFCNRTGKVIIDYIDGEIVTE